MPRPSKPAAIPAAIRAKYDPIAALVDRFCRERLNKEYHEACMRLLGVLARKRPSPIARGTPDGWASGVVRTIGRVNFLDDPSQTPHVKSPEIDRAMGVSGATGSAKAKAIRDLLKIRSFDTEWTLPSRMGSNPLAWLIQVNGMLVDARWMPREVQEEAFERGMIPYLPAEADTDEQDDEGNEDSI